MLSRLFCDRTATLRWARSSPLSRQQASSLRHRGTGGRRPFLVRRVVSARRRAPRGRRRGIHLAKDDRQAVFAAAYDDNLRIRGLRKLQRRLDATPTQVGLRDALADGLLKIAYALCLDLLAFRLSPFALDPKFIFLRNIVLLGFAIDGVNQGWVAQWLRQAGKLQGRIDAEERDDFYKQFPSGYEIKDTVAAVKSAAQEFISPLLKLEMLWKKFPANPFFGEIGSTLDNVISMIRQYRRAAGEHSADKDERKLAKLQELENKARTQEITIEGLRSEVEELRAKL